MKTVFALVLSVLSISCLAEDVSVVNHGKEAAAPVADAPAPAAPAVDCCDNVVEEAAACGSCRSRRLFGHGRLERFGHRTREVGARVVRGAGRVITWPVRAWRCR